ncbi:site-specific DNA-methyltransferase [Aquamicrobium lusatiense]|uniref:DNA-methyltransferase n=1 Tax=Aquamicrobium lusatiense TaxID=89772 RepID=UPI0024578B29|nr:site-specific DNA-methyltransferase [Aquamicrobium lusatiense]MDH4992236.1 site-specific DNA-methyltransferase [Aquamicrobium lusatiense]
MPKSAVVLHGSSLQKTDGENPESDEGDERRILPIFTKKVVGDARHVPLKSGDADVVITSPPYWLKRDYGVDGQIGQEATADGFVGSLIDCMENWKTILPKWGSVFINIGDTYHKGSLANTPGRLEFAAHNLGWTVRNRIIWIKDAGMPDPAKDRLKSRHEYIIHFTQQRRDYYYDQFGYAEKYGNGTGPSDVWQIGLRRDVSDHLAPYPEELVDRILTLACPEQVCTQCGKPRRRLVERTAELDPARPQAKRAMELARQHKLTDAHIAAIQATGISDAGKAMKTQTGTGRNSASVRKLAAEAKLALGGYFREFTFAKRRSVGWSECGCNAPFRPGIVLDPFMGTGTTLRAATDAGRSGIGVDLALETDSKGSKRRGGRGTKS